MASASQRSRPGRNGTSGRNQTTYWAENTLLETMSATRTADDRHGQARERHAAQARRLAVGTAKKRDERRRADDEAQLDDGASPRRPRRRPGRSTWSVPKSRTMRNGWPAEDVEEEQDPGAGALELEAPVELVGQPAERVRRRRAANAAPITGRDRHGRAPATSRRRPAPVAERERPGGEDRQDDDREELEHRPHADGRARPGPAGPARPPPTPRGRPPPASRS